LVGNLLLQCFVQRGLDVAGGHARVKYGHVRSEVGLHRVNQTERSKKEKITEKNPGGDFHKGVKFLQWGFVYEVNYNYTDETARRRVLHFAVFVIGHSLSHKNAQMGFLPKLIAS